MHNECTTCVNAGRECLPFLLSLSSTELLDWCRERKMQIRMTNSDIAGKSGVPLGTVNRVLASQTTDTRVSTILPIILALLDVEQEDVLVCPAHQTTLEGKELAEKLQQLEEENDELKQRVQDIRQHGHEDSVAVKQEFHERIDFLREQLHHEQETSESRKKAVITLAICLGLTLLLIIVALIIDRLDPNIGFFWRSAFSHSGNSDLYLSMSNLEKGDVIWRLIN